MAEAEACVVTTDTNIEVQGKAEEMIEMNTFTLNINEERARSNEAEVVINNSCDGKTVFTISCVGPYCGSWSKGVFIEDYLSSDETIRENPFNGAVIGASYSNKCLYDREGKEIEIEIWNVAEQERYFPLYGIYGRISEGAILFWGPKTDTMECALKYKNEITQIKPNIPVVLVVDNVFQKPSEWIGQGLMMNSREEMDNFCLEHGFFAWFEMLERAGGEKSVFGQAMATLINEIISRNNTQLQANKTPARSKNRKHSCVCS